MAKTKVISFAESKNDDSAGIDYEDEEESISGGGGGEDGADSIGSGDRASSRYEIRTEIPLASQKLHLGCKASKLRASIVRRSRKNPTEERKKKISWFYSPEYAWSLKGAIVGEKKRKVLKHLKIPEEIIVWFRKFVNEQTRREKIKKLYGRSLITRFDQLIKYCNNYPAKIVIESKVILVSPLRRIYFAKVKMIEYMDKLRTNTES